MNRTQLHQDLQAITEDEFLPGSIHLWQGVRQSLVAKRLLLADQGETKMTAHNEKKSVLGWVVGVSVTVILLGVFFFGTPQGKVLAQEIVSFFTRGDSNQQTVNQIEASLEPQPTELAATPLVASPVLDEGCGTPLLPRCTLEEVQEDTPFTIQGFGTLPEGMAFSGATTIPNGALLQYTGDYGTLVLIETVGTAKQFGTWFVGKDAHVQSIMINQYPAEYVQGSWLGYGGIDTVVVWDESIPSKILRWQAGEIEFTLEHGPAGGTDGPIGYDMLQLKALAEGIQTDSDTSISNVPEAGITLSEAEGQAGFNYVETDQIPAGLTLFKTTYNSQNNTICQYYRGYRDLPEFPTLVIAQSTWPMPTLEGFQSKAYWGDMQVEIALEQETMTIEGADGIKGDFYETGIQIDAFCGGIPTGTRRALLWQKQNRTFAVLGRLDAFEGSSFVSKLEMQRLAESLNGIIVDADKTALDPERLLSNKDAESLTGIHILQPASMLSTYHFYHINAWFKDGKASRVVTEYSNNAQLMVGNVRILVFQDLNPTASLDEYRLGMTFSDTVVRSYPAIYHEEYSDSGSFGTSCYQQITWFEDGVEFDLISHSETKIPPETLIAIANSMN